MFKTNQGTQHWKQLFVSSGSCRVKPGLCFVNRVLSLSPGLHQDKASRPKRVTDLRDIRPYMGTWEAQVRGPDSCPPTVEQLLVTNASSQSETRACSRRRHV